MVSHYLERCFFKKNLQTMTTSLSHFAFLFLLPGLVQSDHVFFDDDKHECTHTLPFPVHKKAGFTPDRVAVFLFHVYYNEILNKNCPVVPGSLAQAFDTISSITSAKCILLFN